MAKKTVGADFWHAGFPNQLGNFCFLLFWIGLVLFVLFAFFFFDQSLGEETAGKFHGPDFMTQNRVGELFLSSPAQHFVESVGDAAGNILGAKLGLAGIPEKYTENLELKDIILQVADDLWHDCRMTEHSDGDDPAWRKKYIDMSYLK